MNRRDVITGLGSAAMWPLLAHAAGKRPHVAVLTLLSQQDEGSRVAAFIDGMRELGYVAGQTVDIDYRYAEGDTGRLQPLARELIALAPDVVFAAEPSTARAVKTVAPDVPIVCPILSDRLPDLFASYAHPGGSVTGIATIVEGLNEKLVELAVEVAPGTTRLGLLLNPAGANRAFVEDQVRATASARGMRVIAEKATVPDEIVPALERIAAAGAQIVIVQPNAMLINQRKTIIQQTLARSLPTIFGNRDDVAAGGFMSYGINGRIGSRRSAAFVDKILKGAKPGDLPIEFPTKIDLVINLKTAKALGLEVPTNLLARADEVIE